MTAVAVVRAGLDPKAPLGRWVPEARGRRPAAHAARALAGAPRGARGAPQLLRAAACAREWRRRDRRGRMSARGRERASPGCGLGTGPRNCRPRGFAPLYSDLGYLLAGAALARAVGARDAGEAIAKLVLEPLGIADRLGTVRDLEARGVRGAVRAHGDGAVARGALWWVQSTTRTLGPVGSGGIGARGAVRQGVCGAHVRARGAGRPGRPRVARTRAAGGDAAGGVRRQESRGIERRQPARRPELRASRVHGGPAYVDRSGREDRRVAAHQPRLPDPGPRGHCSARPWAHRCALRRGDRAPGRDGVTASAWGRRSSRAAARPDRGAARGDVASATRRARVPACATPEAPAILTVHGIAVKWSRPSHRPPRRRRDPLRSPPTTTCASCGPSRGTSRSASATMAWASQGARAGWSRRPSTPRTGG